MRPWDYSDGETGAEEEKQRRILHDDGHRSLANQQLHTIRAKHSINYLTIIKFLFLKEKVFRK
jgi:hypothetical protein